MTTKCPFCENGTIEWNDKETSYFCSNCDFEMPFSLDKKLPTYFMKGKHFLGSFIEKEHGEKGYWRKLRKLHKNISTAEEWQRRKEHFESSVDYNTPFVLKMWSGKTEPEMGPVEKSRIAMEITDKSGIPKSVVCEILHNECEWKNSAFFVWNYLNMKRYGREIELLWKKLKGDRIKKQNEIRQASLIEAISENIGLNPYCTSKVLSYMGLMSCGNWYLWTNEQIQEYGSMVGMLWNNKKAKATDDWTLCEAVEQISRDTKDLINPYVVFHILADTKRIKLEDKETCYLYAKYKYAKKALEAIAEEGPKCARELKCSFGVSKRVMNSSLGFLHENNNNIGYYKGQSKDRYYYLKGQEEQLKQAEIYLKLEDIVLNHDAPFITLPELKSISGVSEDQARTLLRNLADKNKVLVVNELKPKLYIVLNGHAKEEAVKLALAEKFSNVLSEIEKGSHEHKSIAGGIKTSNQRILEKLDVLEKYGLVYEKDGLFYSA